jgi:hypothetical protein
MWSPPKVTPFSIEPLWPVLGFTAAGFAPSMMRRARLLYPAQIDPGDSPADLNEFLGHLLRLPVFAA